MNSLKFVLQIPKQLRTPFCELPEPRALPWCRVAIWESLLTMKNCFFSRGGGGGGEGRRGCQYM